MPLIRNTSPLISAVVAIVVAISIGCAAIAAPRPLVVATGTLPAGKVNPHDSTSITRAWLFAAMFDSLTFLDREGKLQPWLATDWQRLNDHEWQFELRDDVRFSNGKHLTARDVVKNFEYLISSQGIVEQSAPFADSIESLGVVDEYRVRIVTKYADPVLPRKLSLVRIAALPEDAPFQRERLIQNAIGSGPYKVSEWGSNTISFDAVPTSWRQAPTEKMRAISIPDGPSRRTAIISGAADIAFAAFNFDELDEPNKTFHLEPDEIPAVVALAFNTELETPLQDPRVREALNYAVRVDEIVEILFAGRATRASQPARKEFLGYNDALEPAGYDLERARALLKEAGYPDGFAFDMSLTSGATVWDQFFLMLASDLAKVGIDVTIKMVTPPLWVEQLYATGVKTEAYGTALFAPTFDALDALRLHSCSWQASTYCDPVAQKLDDQARAASELDARSAVTEKLMKRSREMQQAMYLYESVGLVGYSKRISGFRSDFGFIRYELMTVDDAATP